MAEIIQYWDAALKKYVEVTTTSPFPTTAGGTPTPDDRSVGTQGNAWDNAAVAANGTSIPVLLESAMVVSVFGHSSAATTIDVEVSQDNTMYYKTGFSITVAANADFHLSLPDVAERYIRLTSTADSTITATIVGKG